MERTSCTPARRATRPLGAALLATLALLVVPAAANAALVTFGSKLSRPAALNTAENLSYVGTFTPVPPSPEAPSGVVHTGHWGADTALWNIKVAGGQAAAPASGQAVKVRLEGCVQQAPGGPPPLNQIHLQSLSPTPGGGATVDLTSQAFEIPICGQGGADGTTISTYEPINLCVSAGDYVGFNDEGGFVETFYRAGAPFKILSHVGGSAMDSFIRGNGTGNGSVFSPTDVTANDGFAENRSTELMLQVVLGTGSDARYVCPGGTRDAPPVLTPLKVRPQTDGVNHSRMIAVAMYCRPASGCKGMATLTIAGSSHAYGGASFEIPGNATSHVPVEVSSELMSMIRQQGGVSVNVDVLMNGQHFSQTISVKIL